MTIHQGHVVLEAGSVPCPDCGRPFPSALLSSHVAWIHGPIQDRKPWVADPAKLPSVTHTSASSPDGEQIHRGMRSLCHAPECG